MTDGMKRAFVSYAGRDHAFVLRVVPYLSRHFRVFCYQLQQVVSDSYKRKLAEELSAAEIIIAFVGAELGEVQRNELFKAMNDGKSIIVVPLKGSLVPGGVAQRPADLPYLLPAEPSGELDLAHRPFVPPCDADEEPHPLQCAKRIVNHLAIAWPDFPCWSPVDGIPQNPHLFSYEKTIIQFYLNMMTFGDLSDLSRECPDPVREAMREECRQKILEGCPPEWPQVVDMLALYPDVFRRQPRPMPRGDHQKAGDRVASAALRRSSLHSDGEFAGLDFPEARPPQHVVYPRATALALKAGIVVSGGIAPGINAVIDGIVQRHWSYAREAGDEERLEIRGYQNGFHALLHNTRAVELFPDEGTAAKLAKQGAKILTSMHANEGGSVLGTFRLQRLLSDESRPDTLDTICRHTDDLDILYVIGGDGSMKAAHALWTYARDYRARRKLAPLSVVAVPKTMDNDILWVWQSFGFLSAVEKAKEIIEILHTEVRSNPRICVLQLFGSDSGFVVSHAVHASAFGQCDLALIPEVEFSMLGIAHYLKERICERSSRGALPNALIVMAETAIPVDAVDYLDDAPSTGGARDDESTVVLSSAEKEAILRYDAMRRDGRRIEGQTSDVLRNAGVKLLMRGLRRLLPLETLYPKKHKHVDWARLRIFDNEPRQILRAIKPSTSDIVTAQRLGVLAVDNAMAGYSDFMVSQWLTEYVLVPLDLVVLGRKRMPETGIFWQSVLAKTGQKPDLVAPWSPPKTP